MKYWTVVKGIAQRVKEEAEDQYAEVGIERKIEVLPSPTQALRLPRKDRLLEPGSLEAMEKPKDGEAFWKGLKQYRLEEIVKENVRERELGEHRRKPYRGPKRRKKREPEEEKTEEEKEELRARATGKWEGSGTGAQEGNEGAEGAGEHDAISGVAAALAVAGAMGMTMMAMTAMPEKAAMTLAKPSMDGGEVRSRKAGKRLKRRSCPLGITRQIGN